MAMSVDEKRRMIAHLETITIEAGRAIRTIREYDQIPNDMIAAIEYSVAAVVTIKLATQR
jgi:hypothetical protein